MDPKQTTATRYIIESLAPHHDRQDFQCGVEALDRYFTKQAGQDARKRIAAPFVLLDTETAEVIGYYTLSMSSIVTKNLPTDFTRKLPRYEALPAVLLGRLAVNQKAHGQGFGETLLYDALHRALENPIAATVVMVDAINEQAKTFYLKHDFLPLPDQEMRLFLPMKTVDSIFRGL